MILASVDVGNAPLSFHIRRRLRLGGQLQHGRVLTHAQTSEQHDLPVWELKRIVMYTRLFLVDLSEPGHFRSELSSCRPFRKGTHSTSFSNATSVPGRRHTATFGSPTPAKPPVIELLNFADTSLSPTFAGRDAT
jgi:hypothetical protein